MHQITADSAATASYHVGKNPDYRTITVAKNYGITINHKARQICNSDFDRFDLIIAMDETNLLNSEKIRPAANKTPVKLMRSFDTITNDLNLPDPYYGNITAFEEVYQILARCNHHLLNSIMQKKAI